MMRVRLSSFFCGVALCFVGWLGLLVADSRQAYQKRKLEAERAGRISEPSRFLKASELEGQWQGHSGDYDRYVITRRPDGSFTKVTQVFTGPGAHPKQVIRENGFWTYSKPVYVEVASTETRLFTTVIEAGADSSLSYRISEGDYADEIKKPQADKRYGLKKSRGSQGQARQ